MIFVDTFDILIELGGVCMKEIALEFALVVCLNTFVVLMLLLFFYMLTYLKSILTKKPFQINTRNWIKYSLFFIYILSLICVTLVFREESMGRTDLHLFSSYLRAWHQFDSGGWQMLVINVLMFIPLGIFLPCLIKVCHSLKWTLLISFTLTFLIEVLQYITNTGVFEVDDLLNNCLGSIVGWGIVMAFISYNKKNVFRHKIAYLSPLIIMLCLTISANAFYYLKPYGNFSTAPVHSWNMKNTEIIVEETMSKESGIKPIFQLSNMNYSEINDYASKILQAFSLNLNCSEYDDSQIVYKNSTQSLIVERQGNFILELAPIKNIEINEDDLFQVLDKYNLTELKESKITINEFTATILVPFTVIDDVAYSGEIHVYFDENKNLAKFVFEVNHSNFIENEEIKSEEEAWNLVESGWFRAYQVSEINKIECLSSSLVYQRDSKDYYQPVYQFSVLINDVIYSELLIPAIK